MFSSTTRVCPSTSNGQIAGFLNPVLASCQLVNVSRPGEEPEPWEAQEDMRLLSPELSDKNGEFAYLLTVLGCCMKPPGCHRLQGGGAAVCVQGP